MSRLCHRLVLAASVAASVLAPAAASAVTVDQIVALAHGGVTDAVILALIDRDKTILPLDAEQLVMLKAEGVSEPVILAMLRSGREEGDRAAQAEADLRAAMILAERSSGPEVTIIGSGWDAPGPGPGFYSAPAAGSYFVVPYVPSWRAGDRGARIPRSGLRGPRYGFRDVTSPPHTGAFVSPIQPVVPPIGVVIPPTAPTRR